MQCSHQACADQSSSTAAAFVLSCSWAKSAVAVALQQFRQLQDEAQGKPVFIAEIGWPSRSGEVDSSRSGMEHAAAFAQAWMQVWAV
jgi:exo-beta-1,3-glucanase (GH17 family)